MRLTLYGADDGFRTFNAFGPEAQGLSLDTVVDWLIDAGEPVTRIDDYAEWFQRFEIGLRSAPERLAPVTALPLLEAFRCPAEGRAIARTSTSRLSAAVRDAGLGDAGEVPVPSRPLVDKYVSDLAALGLTDSRGGPPC